MADSSANRPILVLFVIPRDRMRGLVALLFLAQAVSAVDKFVFDVEFTCGYNQREKYSYNVQFIEQDSFLSSNEPITQQKIGQARPGESHFQMEGTQNGDEWFSKGYNVRMDLYHDCTEYQTEVELQLELEPLCEIGKGVCHYHIKKDIKDASGSSKYQAKLEYQ